MNYQTNFGLVNYMGVWINRIIWLAVLVMAILNFSENPNGLTILIFIVLFILARIQTEQFTVNDNAIEIKRRFFLDLIPIRTKIPKNRLRDIQIHGSRTMRNNILLNILPFGLKLVNRITFILDDGGIKSFRTEIFVDQLELFKANCSKDN
jgi:hypothetical protein